jgi:hypothetical protein
MHFHSGGAPADRGAALQGDEDGVLEQGKFDEQRAQHMKGRTEGEGEPFTGSELLQRRWKTEAATLGGFGAEARETVGGSERKGTRETPEFYMDRERGKGKWKGVAAGGLANDGRRAKRCKEQKEWGNGK